MITARVRVKTSGLDSVLRAMVSVTLLPGAPRIFFTASLIDRPRTGVSSILTIRSPLLMPAFCAGVSSIGATTLTRPSSVPISIPRPPNSPWVPSRNSLNASGS
ncbi:hypothetical protein D3C72_2019360 [compost metagenome]